VRIASKGDSVLIAGEKSARRGRGESSFHLVERGYGRFARVVHVGRACDTSRAKATLAAGELRISLPKVVDRRGRLVPIAIIPATNG
jgi:HSP20 family molecular chaperone IbpA